MEIWKKMLVGVFSEHSVLYIRYTKSCIGIGITLLLLMRRCSVIKFRKFVTTCTHTIAYFCRIYVLFYFYFFLFFSAPTEWWKRQLLVQFVRSGRSRRITGRRTLHGLCQSENCGRRQSKNISTEDVSWPSGNDDQRTTYPTGRRTSPTWTSSSPRTPRTWRRWRCRPWGSMVWNQWQFSVQNRHQQSDGERSLSSLLWKNFLSFFLWDVTVHTLLHRSFAVSLYSIDICQFDIGHLTWPNRRLPRDNMNN